MRKGFTLIELVVALAILAIMMAFAGEIFRVSVGAQRLALANGEIMQKLRIITEQLDADFRGLLLDYGGSLGTRSASSGGQTVNQDAIAFFATGDFQSTHLYGTPGQPVVGNVASIFYGPASYTQFPPPQERLLLRRQTILAPGAPPATSDWQGEYYVASLEQWRVSPPFTDPNARVRLPTVDPNDPQKYMPLYLAKGVDDFTIYYADGTVQSGTGMLSWLRVEPGAGGAARTTEVLRPRAFKFEFTLYDSKGLIRGGRRFSHIVSVDR